MAHKQSQPDFSSFLRELGLTQAEAWGSDVRWGDVQLLYRVQSDLMAGTDWENVRVSKLDVSADHSGEVVSDQSGNADHRGRRCFAIFAQRREENKGSGQGCVNAVVPINAMLPLSPSRLREVVVAAEQRLRREYARTTLGSGILLAFCQGTNIVVGGVGLQHMREGAGLWRRTDMGMAQGTLDGVVLLYYCG